MTRIVTTWQEEFGRSQFAVALGIPVEEEPDMLMAYVGIFCVEVTFVRLCGAGRSEHWSKRWGKREFLRALGIHPSLAKSLVFVAMLDQGRPVELRFVS